MDDKILNRLAHIHNTLGVICESNFPSGVQSLLIACIVDLGNIVRSFGMTTCKQNPKRGEWPDDAKDIWDALR